MPDRNPNAWTEEEVRDFASDAEPEQVEAVLRELLADSSDQAVRVITHFLGANHRHVMLKPVASQLATRALLSLGPPGVEMLVSRLLDADTFTRYRSSILAALWEVSRGRSAAGVMSRDYGGLEDLVLPEGTTQAADRGIRDIFAEALVDPNVLSTVTLFLQQRAQLAAVVDDGRSSDAAELMSLLGEASIKLSHSILDEFERLLGSAEREEVYQQFLAAHPVLLDPLAADVTPKQRLGLEHATDYAVRSHDGRWLLVEIERPQDLLFNEAGDFRERFTHAFGQVLDFQNWVDNNVAYAQRHMDGISAPRGLVVIGMRAALTDLHQAKLRQYVENSRRIDVMTFDDLLVRSRSLYENLWHHP